MKILHLSSALTWRGGEQQIAYLTKELSKKGIEQIVCCPKNSALEKHCQQQQLQYIAYPKGFSMNPFVAKLLATTCKKEQVSVIHLHDAHAHNYGVLSASLFGNKTPMVLSRRVDFPIKAKGFSNWKYNHPRIKKILCVSNEIKNIIEPNIKNKAVLETVYSGIDLNRFSNVAKGNLRESFNIPSADTKIIANIAAIAAHKDYFTFVDTAEILIQKGLKARFFIIGKDDGEKEKIVNYIAEKNIQNYFIFTGFRNDIPSILTEIDVLLFTSKTEGLGTSLLDTFASKVPVVATDAGGIKELVLHQKTGWSASVGNAKQLAEGVVEILGNDKLRNQVIEGASLHVQQFTKEQTAMNTLDVYESVIRE